jgi:ribosomal protein S8E
MKRRRVVSTISHASRVQYNQQGVLTKGKIAEFDSFFLENSGEIFFLSPTQIWATPVKPPEFEP